MTNSSPSTNSVSGCGDEFFRLSPYCSGDPQAQK
jgi:hypothetical protein